MHILHVSPYYAPAYAFGGVVRAVEGLAGALARRGHAVTVLTTDALSPSERSPTPTETRDGVTVIRVPNLSLLLRRRVNLSTPLGMRAHRDQIAVADVIHLHELRTIEAQIVVPAAARAGVPVVLSAHGTLDQTTGRSVLKQVWDRLLTPRSIRGIYAIAALTEAEAEAAQALWTALRRPLPPVTIIPNGVNMADFPPDAAAGSAFRQRHGLPPDAPICLFMGRLHPRKGVAGLIRAFAAAAVPTAHLVIAGPDEGTLAELQALVSGDPRLAGRVLFTGYIDGQERSGALSAASVFALPAVGEGLSMAALEALAAGLPVILSPGCSLPEAAAAGAGLIVGADAAQHPPDADLAAALRALLTDETRRRAMSAAARELIAARYTWDRVAAAVEEVYARVAAR